FAILGGDKIYNNTILCGVGEYTARGIAPHSGTEGNLALVYGNEVHVQQLANNQEYGGVPLGGAYGIQIEDKEFLEVYDNEITVYGTTKGTALRFSGLAEHVHVHHNTLRVVTNGGFASALSFYGKNKT